MLWDKLPQGPPTQVLYGRIGDDDDETGLKIYTKKVGQAKQVSTLSTPLSQSPDSGLETHRLCLFKLSMPTSSSLVARITHHRMRLSRSTNTGFYFAYHSPETQPSLSYIYHHAPYLSFSTSSSAAHSDETSLVFSIDKLPHYDHRLVELGTYISSPTSPNADPDLMPLHLMTIQHISILPAAAIPKPSAHRITNLRIATRGVEPYAQKRLVWDFHSNSSTLRDGLPYSETTGPFSHFLVSVDGRFVGRAYACEYPLTRKDFDELDSESHKEGHGEDEVEVEVSVEGVLFGGEKVLGEGIKIGVEDVSQ